VVEVVEVSYPVGCCVFVVPAYPDGVVFGCVAGECFALVGDVFYSHGTIHQFRGRSIAVNRGAVYRKDVSSLVSHMHQMTVLFCW
jgi:hypothetical protein